MGGTRRLRGEARAVRARFLHALKTRQERRGRTDGEAFRTLYAVLASNSDPCWWLDHRWFELGDLLRAVMGVKPPCLVERLFRLLKHPFRRRRR